MKIVNCRNELYNASAFRSKRPTNRNRSPTSQTVLKWTSQRNNNCLCHISDCLLTKIRFARIFTFLVFIDRLKLRRFARFARSRTKWMRTFVLWMEWEYTVKFIWKRIKANKNIIFFLLNWTEKFRFADYTSRWSADVQNIEDERKSLVFGADVGIRAGNALADSRYLSVDVKGPLTDSCLMT